MRDFLTIMEEAKKTYSERRATYGEKGYLKQGGTMALLFPDGLVLKTEEDFNRYYLVTMAFTKLLRYCRNINNGGHQDSAHDLGVYAFLLEEFDSFVKEPKK